MEVVKHWLVVQLRYFNEVVFNNLYLDEYGRYYISQDESPCVLIDFKKAESLISQTKQYFKEKEELRLKKAEENLKLLKQQLNEADI